MNLATTSITSSTRAQHSGTYAQNKEDTKAEDKSQLARKRADPGISPYIHTRANGSLLQLVPPRTGNLSSDDHIRFQDHLGGS